MRHKAITTAAYLLAGASALALPAASWAAEQAPAAESTAQAADDEAPLPTDEIIVSARRRDETLQSTPIAISAVNAAMLENRASINIGALQGDAPNLLITQQNAGPQAANISIRGLSFANIEKSSTPTVGVVIDGVMIGTSSGQLLDFFDIDQIEVLRGPQGTLFGANTIGGVISITRSRPTKELGAKLEASYGRWNTWNTRAVVNFGDGNTFGVKLWHFHSESDGFLYNPILQRHMGGSNNDSFGGTILFEPDGSNFDAMLSVEKVQQSFEPVVSNITNSSEAFSAFMPAGQFNRNTTSDLYTVFGRAARSTYSAPNATLTMNLTTDPVKLTAITGWRHSTEHHSQDYDGSSAEIYFSDRAQRYTQWSQELRAAGKIVDSLDYVVGGYFFDSKFSGDNDTFVFGADTGRQVVRGHTRSYAVFGDFNWTVNDKVRVSFGGRWSLDKKFLSNAYPGTLGVIGVGRETFRKFTPKIGVDYRPNSDTLLYASWTQGYRSGGFSPRAQTALTAGTPYQPETVDSYEIGAKLDLLDRKLQFNVAAFVAKYKSMQQDITLPGGPAGSQTITGNVGSATNKGIELEATLRPVEGLKLTANAAFLDAKFKGFIAPNSYNGALVPFDYSKNNLIYAPKFSGSVSAEYTAPTRFGSIVGNVSLRHIAPYDEQISTGSLTPTLTNGVVTSVTVNGNDPRVRTATQDLVDASITANFELGGADAYFRVFGRNLANIKTTTAAFTVAGLWSFASALEPRTYGATVGVKF